MYRMMLCKITLLASIASVLRACGQSGALVLPSDPDYDKRSHYLLYPDAEQKTVQPAPVTSETPSSQLQN